MLVCRLAFLLVFLPLVFFFTREHSMKYVIVLCSAPCIKNSWNTPSTSRSFSLLLPALILSPSTVPNFAPSTAPHRLLHRPLYQERERKRCSAGSGCVICIQSPRKHGMHDALLHKVWCNKTVCVRAPSRARRRKTYLTNKVNKGSKDV